MNKTILTLSCTSLLGLTTHTQAATALIDFGRAANATTNPSGGLYYNNAEVNTINSGAPGDFTINGAGTTLSLIDTTNAATGWTVSLAKTTSNGGGGSAGSGGDYTGTFPVSIDSFATTALQDGIYINNGGVIQVTFSGLSSGFTYDLTTYGARNSGGSNETWSLLEGTSSDPATVTFNVTGNSTTTPTWSGITANESGEIAFTISAESALSGAASQLNFISLTATAVPEPSSTALIGLAGLGFILRRRR